MNWLPRKTIIVPIDFSEGSFDALATAREMVDDPDDLHVVHVLPNLEANDPGVIWQTIDDASRGRHARESLRQGIRDHGQEPVDIVILFGDPGHEIADYANEVDAGLVVVSSHGKTALQHLLIGSVAERVVRLAQCPVLVLRK